MKKLFLALLLSTVAIAATPIPSRFKDAVFTSSIHVGGTTAAYPNAMRVGGTTVIVGKTDITGNVTVTGTHSISGAVTASSSITALGPVSVKPDLSAAHSSALLDLGGTTKGVLLPRVTQTQRDGISSPATGLLVYNSDSKNINQYNGTAWGEVSGSGGGGAISELNLIQDNNSDFETFNGSAFTNWTASGGSISQATSGSNLLIGASSAVFNASSASQTFTSDAITVTSSTVALLGGANGTASCWLKTTATDYKLQVYDGTNVIAERTIPALAAPKVIAVAFPIPTSGTIAVRVISASDAADLAIDNCYLGSTTVFDISQSELYGTWNNAGTASCDWNTSSTSFADFSADTDCPTPTVTGKVTAAATKVPHIVLSNHPPGKYVVSFAGTLLNEGTNDPYQCRLVDDSGTVLSSLGGASGLNDGAGSNIKFPVGYSGVITYSTSGTHTIKIQCKTAATTVHVQSNVASQDASFVVARFPIEVEQAMRPDQVAWFVDATITGTSPDLGVAAVASATGITSSSLTLTQESGSIQALIPCSSTNESSGTTCSSGDESLGVAFTLPAAGAVKACAQFTHQIQIDVTEEIATYFRIVETPNAAQTISQGDKIHNATGMKGGTGGADMYWPVVICQDLIFSSAGKKTVRVFYTQNVGGTPNQSNILTGGGAQGSTFKITVWPMTQDLPAPLLVNSVVSNRNGVERVERATIGNDGTATIIRQSGSWISSVNRSSAGVVDYTLASGIFSATPECVVTAKNGTTHGSRTCEMSTTESSTAITTLCAGDYNHVIICHGPR